MIVPLGEADVCVVGGEGLELVGLGGSRRPVRSGRAEMAVDAEPIWLEGAGAVWAAYAPPWRQDVGPAGE